MPLPLMLAVSSASTVSSVSTPLVFNCLTAIVSALASGTGVFLLTNSFSNMPSVLLNQGETILNDINLLVHKTAQDTIKLNESIANTDNIIQNSVNTLDSYLNVLSDNNQYLTTSQLPFNLLDTSLFDKSSVMLNGVTIMLENECQNFTTQQKIFVEIIHQLRTASTQCRLEKDKLLHITQTLMSLLPPANTVSLNRCMAELRQEKAINQEMYTTIEALLAENIAMKKMLKLQDSDETENNHTVRFS